MKRKKPNILMILWHDVGDHLGCYNYPGVRTPSVDRIAREGIALDNYYAACPICGPSRAATMTGLLPHQNGVFGQVGRGWDMRRDIVPLPQHLKRAGYTTALLGICQEAQDPKWLGYDTVIHEPDETHAEHVGRLLAQNREAESPFFIYVATTGVHRPNGDTYDQEVYEELELPAYLPDTKATRKDMACFYRHVEETDAFVGDMLDVLDQNGLAEDTLVIFTTDHGPPYPRSKATQYDAGLKIALAARWPGRLESGTRSDAFLSNTDFMPTLLDLVGVDLPGSDKLYGRSFAHLLNGTGKAGQGRDEFIAEHTYAAIYSPQRSIRTDRYKFIINFEPRSACQAECGFCYRVGFEQIAEYYSGPVPEEELYDLEADPNEFCNLALSPRHGAIRRSLRQRLMRVLRDTDDPILKGPIADPSGDHTPFRTLDHMWIRDEDGNLTYDIPPQSEVPHAWNP